MNTFVTTVKPARMLVVEDEPSARGALRKYFLSYGLQVDCACELEEAEALIAVRHYDVVIADLRLSWTHGVEGLEILRFVRRQSRGTHVIILSAHATPDIRRSADALGADAFIHKPAPLPEIADAVSRALARSF
jgi:DNA-binding response OmpR family regulator